jgi:transcriptional regulator PpsR
MDTREPLNSVDVIQNHTDDVDTQAIARLLASASDIALVIDRRGAIADIAVSSAELQHAGCVGWIGRQWIDTVATDSRQNVKELLKPASEAALPSWRDVNHLVDHNGRLPIRYSAIHLGESGKVVAIGHDVRTSHSATQRLAQTQQTVEREYARLRHAETRYRVLFNISSEAVLILNAAATRIVESNKSACELLGLSARRLKGQSFHGLLTIDDQDRALAFLTSPTSTSFGDEITIQLASRDIKLAVTATQFRQHEENHLLVRLTPSLHHAPERLKPHSTTFEVLDRLPDGFVITDPDLRILTANRAFLDLTELSSEEQVHGERLDRWIGRHPSEVATVLQTLKSRGTIENFSTLVRGEYHADTEVEIAAVSALTDKHPCIGLTIRPVRRLSPSRRPAPPPVDTMTNLVGRVHMSDLVRQATEMIERKCIQAALKVTTDNRAAAAELLGLSRQSLYVKLHRYRMAGSEGDENE